MSSILSIHATSLRVVAIRDEARLGEHESRWNALAGEIPFRSFSWAMTWWRHYRTPGSQLFVLLVMDDQQRLLGIAPWYLRHELGRGRVVRFLGSGEVCSDYLTLLADPELFELVAEQIAQWMTTEGAKAWDLLDLDGVEAHDRALGHLTRKLAEQGHPVDRQPELSCWRTPLPETWEQFLASLSKSRRERTRALLRRALDAGRAVVHHVRTESELERAYAILIELHQKRRRSLSQAGCFASSRFTNFHRAMAERLLAEGKLRLFWIELDGRPLAAEYSFLGGDTIFYYQGGFEPELADERPGWLSFAISLKLAIEAGYRSYDFLRGDESYKASWGALASPLVHLRIAGRHAPARLRFAAWRMTEKFKRRMRGLLSRGQKKS